MRKSLNILLVFLLSFHFAGATGLKVIPRPNQVQMAEGEFQLNKSTSLHFDGVKKSSKRLLTDYFIEAGFVLGSQSSSKQQIVLKVSNNPGGFNSDEAYRLEVTPTRIELISPTEKGLFYALQSLIQLPDERKITALKIEDSPRFAYRGMHIDVSRHFVSVDFLKKQIDMMARLKINHFHWHLTDGPGWRLEIKKYPLLTQKAAWRTHETWKDWWATNPREYVDIRSGKEAYGGFYTQKEARDIVRYAAERHITVIPEIEMPGHSEEVCAVYPELSCAGEPYKQSEVCIGNEQTFKFFENVLKEVMKIFPSEYIHIGGDEAEKHHWKECEKCQARMKAEGLKDENELQSYMIRRIEKFLIKNKRKLIGWDEILEGGLAPEATVMSWRGEEGGIKAAKSGHDAIMTPGSHMYFDSYQANPATQPEAIGGFLPLERVYSYDPVPAALSADESKHILGVQANLWAEYIPTEPHYEYMLYPRMLALAEVAWTEKSNKEWFDFRRRANGFIPFLQKKGYNPFTLSTEVAFEHRVDSVDKAILVTLATERHGMDIRYTTDGSEPNSTSDIYSRPVVVKDSALISARLFSGSKAVGEVTSNRFDYHLGIDKNITYHIPVNKYYPASGEKSLIDGELGGLSNSDGRWMGFLNHGMDVTIDLGEVQSLKFISARFMQNGGSWIYMPQEVTISVSEDNEQFTDLGVIKSPYGIEVEGTFFHDFGWRGNTKARYVRYTASPTGRKGGWVFTDEIVIW